MKRRVSISPARKNLSIGFWEGALATPWVFLTVPGNFLIAALLTQYFGVSKGIYGWIVALPAWSNVLQVLLLPFLSRTLSSRDLTLGLSWFNIGLWTLLVATLELLPSDDAVPVARVFLFFFLFSSLSASFVGVGWTTWVRTWVPNPLRGVYFGNRNRVLSLVSIAYLILCSVLLSVAPGALWPYQTLIAIAVAFRIFSIVWQYGIHTKEDLQPVNESSWFHQVREVIRSRNFIYFLLFGAWVSFWMAFVGPFVPIFTFEMLDLTPGQFTHLVLISSAASALGWAFWGKRIDRYGGVTILFVSLLCWELQNYLWAILTVNNRWLLYPMWVWGGFFASGYFLASFNLLLGLIPEKAKTAAISMNLACSSIAAGIAPILAGSLLELYSESSTREAMMSVYRTGFLVKCSVILLSLYFVFKIKEPSGKKTDFLPGALRAVRYLLVTQGVGTIVNSTNGWWRKKK